MYFIPMGILAKDHVPTLVGTVNLEQLTWWGFLNNLIPVSIGNIIGGGVMVALVYYVVYLRGAKQG
jgi:formate/nitrite transporter FocA (FNT family)